MVLWSGIVKAGRRQARLGAPDGTFDESLLIGGCWDALVVEGA
jgi:hypothetical protein